MNDRVKRNRLTIVAGSRTGRFACLLLVFAAALLVAAGEESEEDSEADEESAEEAQSEEGDQTKAVCVSTCEFAVSCDEEDDVAGCTTTCLEEFREMRDQAGEECVDRMLDFLQCYSDIDDCEQAEMMLFDGTCGDELDALGASCFDAMMEEELPQSSTEEEPEQSEEVERPEELQTYCKSICDDLVACEIEEDTDDCRAECEELYELLGGSAATQDCDEPFMGFLKCIDGIEGCEKLEAFDSGDNDEICVEEMQEVLECSMGAPTGSEPTDGVEAPSDVETGCAAICEKDVECGNSSDAGSCTEECLDDFGEFARAGGECKAGLLVFLDCVAGIDDCEEFNSKDSCSEEVSVFFNSCL